MLSGATVGGMAYAYACAITTEVIVRCSASHAPTASNIKTLKGIASIDYRVISKVSTWNKFNSVQAVANFIVIVIS